MSPYLGRVIEVWEEGGLRVGKVEVGGARAVVWLEALPGAAPGDLVLVEAGVALSRVEEEGGERVPGSAG